MNRRNALTVLGAGAVALGATTRAGAAKSTLRVAYIPIENCAQVFYAKEQGFFESAGLDVQLQPIPFGSAIATAIAANSIDVGFAATVTVATAHSRGLPFVFIAPANEFSARAKPTTGIVVGASSTIRSARDLNGKIFGTAGLGSLAEFAPRAWIDANGGDSTTVKFVELPFSALPDALASGRVDAAFIADPFFSKAQETGRVLGTGLDAVAKEFIVGGWIATPAWAAANAGDVAGFAGAIARATAWASANPLKAADTLVRYLKVDPATVAATPRSIFAEKLTPALLQPGIDNASRYGKFAHIPAQDLVYVPGR